MSDEQRKPTNNVLILFAASVMDIAGIALMISGRWLSGVLALLAGCAFVFSFAASRRHQRKQ